MVTLQYPLQLQLVLLLLATHSQSLLSLFAFFRCAVAAVVVVVGPHRPHAVCCRDDWEWIFTFPFPSILMQSIPIPSHSQVGVLD